MSAPSPASQGNPNNQPNHALSTFALDFATAKRQLTGHLALVLEDDTASFGRMFISLSSAGCPATLARRWAQVEPAIRRISPTLILFSTHLGELRSAEIIHRLRESPSSRNAILIAIARHESRRERRALRGLGCDGYVWKPADRYLFAMDLVARTPRLLEGLCPPAAHGEDQVPEVSDPRHE